MKYITPKRTLSSTLLLYGSSVAVSTFAQSQDGYGLGNNMMNGYGGWMGGGMWLMILVVIVVAGFVAWVVAKRPK